MSYQCEILEQPAQPVLAVRTRTAVQDMPGVLGAAYGKIAQYLAGVGEAPTGAPFVGYFNMDMQDLDIEIGFPVAKALPGKDNIQACEIPGGSVATCVHTGPYSALESAYNALQTAIQESGREAAGPAYEFYLNDPGDTPEEKLETKIVLPLK